MLLERVSAEWKNSKHTHTFRCRALHSKLQCRMTLKKCAPLKPHFFVTIAKFTRATKECEMYFTAISIGRWRNAWLWWETISWVPVLFGSFLKGNRNHTLRNKKNKLDWKVLRRRGEGLSSWSQPNGTFWETFFYVCSVLSFNLGNSDPKVWTRFKKAFSDTTNMMFCSLLRG